MLPVLADCVVFLEFSAFDQGTASFRLVLTGKIDLQLLGQPLPEIAKAELRSAHRADPVPQLVHADPAGDVPVGASLDGGRRKIPADVALQLFLHGKV